MLNESTKMEIDATPLPLRKKGRKLKAMAAKAARKRSIEAVDKENDPPEVTASSLVSSSSLVQRSKPVGAHSSSHQSNPYIFFA